MDTKLFDELYYKIDRRLNSENVINKGDEVSAYSLAAAVSYGMSYYNYSFVTEANRIVDLMNMKVNRMFFFRRKYLIPYVSNICPGINENGEKYIEVKFKSVNSENKVGKAIIDKNLNINIEELEEDFSKEETLRFLDSYKEIFERFLVVLDAFNMQYPGISYQWNSNHKERKEYIDDGFNVISLDLERPNEPYISFSNQEEAEIARNHSSKYGELYEYIDFYKSTIMKKMKVNINDLNELYQTIVRNQLEICCDIIEAASIKR